MNQNELVYSCTFDGHEDDPISCFCMNLQCVQKPQCCVECILIKHDDHREDCKTIKRMKQILKNEIQFIDEQRSKVNEAFGNIQKIYLFVLKTLNGEIIKIIELQKKLEKPNFYLYDRDFQIFKKFNRIMQKKPFQGLLDEIMKFRQTIQANEKQKELNIICSENINQDGEIFSNYDDKFSTQIIIQCGDEECYDRKQCCQQCVVQNTNKDLVFQFVYGFINDHYNIINKQINTFQNAFETNQRDFREYDSDLKQQQSKIENINNFFINQKFYEQTQKFNVIKDWMNTKQVSQYQQKKYEGLSILLNEMIDLSGTLSNHEFPQNLAAIIYKQFRNRKFNLQNIQFIDLNFYRRYETDFDKNIKTQERIQQETTLNNKTNHNNSIQFFDQSTQIYPKYIKSNGNKGPKIKSIKNKMLLKTNFYTNDYALQYYNDQRKQFNVSSFEEFLNDGVALDTPHQDNDALKIQGSAFRMIPNNFQELNDRGIVLFHQHNYQEAIHYFDQGIMINPSNSEIFYNKGVALSSLNIYEEAILYFEQAIWINPEYFQAFNNKGIALYNQKRYQEAIQCYDQAIQINPSYFEAFYNKGVALLKLNNFKSAILCFDQAITINPLDSEVLNNKGNALNNLDQQMEAILCYDKVIAIDPQNYLAFNNKGFSLYNLKEYEFAIVFYDIAILINPSYTQALQNKGIALCHLEKYDRAIVCYDQAIQLNPNYFQSYFNKGVTLRNLNRHEDAIQCYDQAIKINPNYTSALFNKGVILSELQNYEKAFECFSNVVIIDPNDKEALKLKEKCFRKFQQMMPKF